MKSKLESAARVPAAVAMALVTLFASVVVMASSAAATAAPLPAGAPAFSSANQATFTNGVAGTFTVTVSGIPAPMISETGALPLGVNFDPATDTISGTPFATYPGRSGLFSITFTATNDAGTATQNFTLTVDQAPAIIGPSTATFTVGFWQSLYITPTGFPRPTLTESAALPPGLTFGVSVLSGVGLLQGAPAPGSSGTYHLTFTADNGVGPPVAQTFDLTVQGGGFTYPLNGQIKADTTTPFSWQPLADAMAYRLVIGTAQGSSNLLDSGVLPNAYPYYLPTALPVGVKLWATLSVERSESWGPYQTIAFTAAPGLAVFSFPTTGQTNVANNRAFTWSAVPGADGYILAVGTRPDSTDAVNSGELPVTQTSYTPSRALPAGVTLYAELLTCVHIQCTRFQAIAFTAAPGAATFIYPVEGQLGVLTSKAFVWSPVPQAQAYYLLVGTTRYGSDVVNSGPLPASSSTYLLPTAAPADVEVFATLFTEVDGTWTRYQAISFSANAGMSYFTSPTEGATGVSPVNAWFTWTYLQGQAQGYYLIVGTTRFGADVLNSGILTVYPGWGGNLPAHSRLYATLFTEIGNTWTRFQAISFTTA